MKQYRKSEEIRAFLETDATAAYIAERVKCSKTLVYKVKKQELKKKAAKEARFASVAARKLIPPPEPKMNDPVNHPPHYTAHPSGVECIKITEHMNFCLGNAVKYIWRADLKGNDVEDLEKARFYLNREIERRRGNG